MKALARVFVASVFCACAALCAPAFADDTLFAPGHERAAEAAGAQVEGLMEEHTIPGMSVAVWMGGPDGRIVWSQAFGTSSIELGVDTSRKTRFRYASTSKVITAAIVAQLAGEGVIDLDADVRRYVPEFPEKEAPITLRQLLGHLSGVRHYQPKDYDLSQPGGMIDLRLYRSTSDALAIFAGDPLVAAPGERYQYSTFAFTLVRAALEGASGEGFLALVRTRVAEPLGLESVGPDLVMEIVPDRTDYHDPREDGSIGLAPPANVAYKWAGGGLTGTADDLVTFGAAHFEPGFIPESIYAQMFVSQADAAGEETGVGLAWRIGSDPAGNTVWHHSGSMGGTRSTLLVFPDLGIAVSLLSNLSGTPGNIAREARLIAWEFQGIEAPEAEGE